MAHVKPAPIAIDKKAAPRAGRFGNPKEILEAPQIMFTSSSSRILRTSFRKVTIAEEIAPTGIANGSMITS